MRILTIILSVATLNLYVGFDSFLLSFLYSLMVAVLTSIAYDSLEVAGRTHTLVIRHPMKLKDSEEYSKQAIGMVLEASQKSVELMSQGCTIISINHVKDFRKFEFIVRIRYREKA